MSTEMRAARRVDARAIGAAVAIAVVARVAVAAAVPLSPPVFDMAEYWTRALYLLEHGQLSPDTGRMPGLPLLLSELFAWAGEPSLTWARGLNVAAGAATTALTYLLARRAASARASLVAALAVALYPTLLVYTPLVTTETVVMPPLMGALLAASRTSPRAAVVAGVLAGVATLVRPAGIAVLPAVLLAALRPWDRADRWHDARRLGAGALVVIGFVLVLAPWWLHGLRHQSRFVPLDTTSGHNLLIGSGPYATGRYRFTAVVRQTNEFLVGIDPTTPEGSAHAAAVAWAHVRAAPGEALSLGPAKLGYLLALEGSEIAYLYSIGHFGEVGPRAVWTWGLAILAAFPVVLAAALAGLARRHPGAALVRAPAVCYLVAAAALSVIAFGEPRFHLPFVPVLAVLATGAARWREGWHRGALVVAAAVLVGLGVVWAGQLGNYLGYLPELAQPGGWQRALSFDDVL
jgi:4-amino-4-deoxy-L-arabinose transferase-like glycosyltransferase